jgi:hypothetical protein
VTSLACVLATVAAGLVLPGVRGRIGIKRLLATGGAKVVSGAGVFRLVPGALGVYCHPAYGVNYLCHHGAPFLMLFAQLDKNSGIRASLTYHL